MIQVALRSQKVRSCVRVLLHFVLILPILLRVPVMTSSGDNNVAATSTSTASPTVSNTGIIDSSPATCTSTVDASSNNNTKTIYLVRHAESDENRRIQSLKTAFTTLTKFGIPKSKDIVASCELLRIDQQIDSNVSTFGKDQISYMANVLDENKFLEKHDIELLVHSPLLRAKETCRDMFHCTDRQDGDESMSESSYLPGIRSSLLPPPSTTTTNSKIKEVIELDLLMEMTPMEWMNPSSLYKRIRLFEDWLSQRNEKNIVCVGHSQYFKRLLHLTYKFHNCDVIQVQFNSHNQEDGTAKDTTMPVPTSKWTNITDLHLCRMPPVTSTTTTPN